jgi:hypothetical protein
VKWPEHVYIETVHSPRSYSVRQLDIAMTLAGALGTVDPQRGRLVLLEKPELLP